MTMHNFVCLKWGEKYPAENVNRLYRMIQKNTTKPFTLYCLTENSSGIDSNIAILPLSELGLSGWWYKLLLFKEDFYGLQGDVLFLDLDVVITAGLDHFFEFKPGEFVIAKDIATGGYNSSVFRIKIGSHHYLWDDFEGMTKALMSQYYGDQDWVTDKAVGVLTWPEQWVVSFKKQCDARAKRSYGILGRYLRKVGAYQVSGKARVPEEARIIQFHGKPDPDDVVDGPYDMYKSAPWIRKFWGED